MKIEELERLAVAATALIGRGPANDVDIPKTVKWWRGMYAQVLAEFIEQEKSEKQNREAE